MWALKFKNIAIKNRCISVWLQTVQLSPNWLHISWILKLFTIQIIEVMSSLIWKTLTGTSTWVVQQLTDPEMKLISIRHLIVAQIQHYGGRFNVVFKLLWQSKNSSYYYYLLSIYCGKSVNWSYNLICIPYGTNGELLMSFMLYSLYLQCRRTCYD